VITKGGQQKDTKVTVEVAWPLFSKSNGRGSELWGKWWPNEKLHKSTVLQPTDVGSNSYSRRFTLILEGSVAMSKQH